jgi:hypothetical protein
MSTYQSNVSSSFVDLATYDALEQYLYSGLGAVTYFIRQSKKSSWFSQVPVILSNASGTADFGNTWSVTISRAGDYLLQNWLTVTTPALYDLNRPFKNFWVKNLMHNLVASVDVTFNDLVAMRIESHQLDFWTAFNVPASKKAGYRQMVGYGVEIPALNGRDNVFLHGLDASVPHKLQLPLPFFYTRASGVALPTAALPYNDMRINFTFRPASELLVAWATGESPVPSRYNVHYTSPITLSLGGSVKVWGNYAVVSNDERSRMGQHTRDIVIEQFHSAPETNFTPGANTTYDIRFSSAVKCLMFALRKTNKSTLPAQNGTSGQVWGEGGGHLSNYSTTVDSEALSSSGYFEYVSPIDSVTMLYENTTRLGSVPSNYFTQISPFYHAETIPVEEPGIHMYSYSLDIGSLDPMGSTNFGRLTNVTMVPVSLSTDIMQGHNNLDTWQFLVTAVVHNIARISGGAFGFPIL